MASSGPLDPRRQMNGGESGTSDPSLSLRRSQVPRVREPGPTRPEPDPAAIRPQLGPIRPEPDPVRAQLGPSRPEPDPVWAQLGLLTRSPRMLAMLEEARDLAASGANALILGETGTGKELLAAGIHHFSRRPGRFLPFNSGGCPAGLFEGELFGVERGAYTGADRKRNGLIVEAENGTLFLDEIGDLDARSQTALLRFLDSGEARALGSSVIRIVRLGVVAATCHPLAGMKSRGDFRRDLYYRLAQGLLELPPLRERPDDLDLLVPHLWRRQTVDREAPSALLGQEGIAVLRSHSWPGNVRELDHFLRRLRLHAVRAGNAAFAEDGIRELLRRWSALSDGAPAARPSPEEARRALHAADGNRSLAAARLGISRASLYRLLPKIADA